jgi:hypothetical protein
MISPPDERMSCDDPRPWPTGDIGVVYESPIDPVVLPVELAETQTAVEGWGNIHACTVEA